MSDIRATLNLAEDDGEPHWAYLREMTEKEKAQRGGMQFGGAGKRVETTVHDGRGKDLTLDTHAFELVQQKTDLSTQDFYDNTRKDDYYKEMEEMFKKHTGAAEVVVFHHQLRNKDKATGSAGTSASVQPYAHAVHSDSHPQHADSLFLQQVAQNPENMRLRQGRYLYINAWRNISETPIAQDHLAVLDESSTIKPDDYITSELFGPGYHLQQYKLNAKNSHMHRWFYFPHMSKDEVLIFKQWDSDPSLSGRCCFHTAFHDPHAPDDTPARQSIEARAICFFPDHTPNTCPPVPEPTEQEKDDDEDVHGWAKKIDGVIDSMPHWPKFALDWVKGQMAGDEDKGAIAIVSTIVMDPQNHQGLQNKSKALKERIKQLLLSDKYRSDAKVKRLAVAIAGKAAQEARGGRTLGGGLKSLGLVALGWVLGYAFHRRLLATGS